MKLLKLTNMLFLMTVLAFSQPTLAVKYVQPSDNKITSSVQYKLATDTTLSGVTIKVSTKSGVVTLAGNVNTDNEASRAVEIAESTPGVKSTNTSQLKVKESKQPFTDVVITAKVKGAFIREKLFGDKEVAIMSINVETRDNVVYLSGSAETEQQADNAVKIAKSITDVRNVESRIEVKPAT